MSRIDTILASLEKVKPAGKGNWLACCPAHGDKTPSLTITESPDGTILMHCFAGCDPYAIVSSIGMELSDLFPEREFEGYSKERYPFDPMSALEAIAFEAFVVNACASTILRGDQLNEADKSRLLQATARLSAAVDYVRSRNRG